MAIPFLRRILFPAPTHKPTSLSFLSSSSFSPPSDQPVIDTVVSLLTHHRSKSRWGHIYSLYPDGFTPNQFSQITLHLKNNPHLALRFFLFTHRRSLCHHDLLSYSTIIHILARARMKTRAQSLIRTAIRVAGNSDGDNDKQLAKPLKVFESLVKTYKVCGSAPFVFDLLIEACLESKKLDGALQIVRMLRSRGISPRVVTCNSLVSSVCRSRGGFAGFDVYREVFGLDGEIEENGKRVVRVRPNVLTFNALMVCFYQDGVMEKVEELWSQMAEFGCAPNAYSYSILMAVFCEEERIEEAEKLWEEMRVKKVEPDVVAYNTIIGGLCQIGEIGRAEEFLREMGLSGIESTSATYEHIANGYCKVGDVDSAILVYKDMCRKSFVPEASTVDAVLGGLCDKRRVFEALEMLRIAMRDSRFYPTGKSYELLIKGLCQEGKMDEALTVQAEMVGKGFEPNSDIYNDFIDGYMKQGDEEAAGMLRKEMLETQQQLGK